MEDRQTGDRQNGERGRGRRERTGADLIVFVLRGYWSLQRLDLLQMIPCASGEISEHDSIYVLMHI